MPAQLRHGGPGLRLVRGRWKPVLGSSGGAGAGGGSGAGLHVCAGGGLEVSGAGAGGFSGNLECLVEDISVLSPPGADEGDCMPKALTLVENHALVAAWWLEMFEALRAEKEQRVRLLYECALTVTIRLYVGTSRQALALMLWQASDKKKQMRAVADDNVITFAKKFQIIVEHCGVLCHTGAR